MKDKKFKILLAGGGTGGHISPAIAIAEELVKQGHQPLIISLEKNKDYPSFKTLNKKIPLLFYKAPLIPKSPLAVIRFISDLRFSWKVLSDLNHSNKPDAIIAFGGYPVFPAVLWSLFNGIPVFLHEQNSHKGLITRLFKIFSKYVMHSFPQKKLSKNEIITGNPLRSGFIKQNNSTSKEIKIKKINKILITGGSQGANDLNNLYLNLINDPYFKNIKFTISTGEKNFQNIKNNSRKRDNVFPFIIDMPKEILNNDLIFCRSGSGSVYESLWSKRPIIFFPYPHATGNHQAINAASVCANSFYSLIDIRPFNEDTARKEIIKIIESLKDKKYDPEFVNSNFPLDANKNICNLVIQSLKN